MFSRLELLNFHKFLFHHKFVATNKIVKIHNVIFPAIRLVLVGSELRGRATSLLCFIMFLFNMTVLIIFSQDRF